MTILFIWGWNCIIFVLDPHNTKITVESTKIYVFTVFKIPKIKPLGTAFASFDDTLHMQYIYNVYTK